MTQTSGNEPPDYDPDDPVAPVLGTRAALS
jgi:hypothetical protein